MICRILRVVAGIVLALIIAAGALLLVRWARQGQIRRADTAAVPPGIDSFETLRLGGVEQWIHIRGLNGSNPLLLVLHGGPGVPTMPLSYVNADLGRYFTVVEWDQRGAGKSFSEEIRPESMNVPQLVRDAEELVATLRARFGQKQIFLLGHSTGTLFGVLLVQAHPEFFRAYVSVSQIADLHASEQILCDFALRSATKKNDRGAVRELRQIGRPPFSTEKQLQISQKWVNHFAPDPFDAIAP